MDNSRKRALEDPERKPMDPASKRPRQHQASGTDTDFPAQTTTTSNPSTVPSTPTLIGSPAPITPSRSLHSSTPSYTSSLPSSQTSESESDVSSSSSEEADSIDYPSTSSAGSRPQHPHSYPPSLLPRMISSSTTSSGSSTDSASYTSASASDDISDLLSSFTDALEDDESISSSASSSSSSSSSPNSALSSSSSTHASQPSHLSIASLTASNLLHLQSRLNALLPKIRRANEVLETERKEGRLEERNVENVRDGDGQGGYIEMDLGLGVLEETTKGGAREDGDGEGGREEVEGGDERLGPGDVLGDMMGKRKSWGKGKGVVGIEEVTC